MVTYIQVGNVLVPQTYYFDEEYWLELDKNEARVIKNTFELAEIGDSLFVTRDTVILKKLKPIK